MSKAYALEFLKHGRRPDRIPVMEHFSGLSREVVKVVTGHDPILNKENITGIYQDLGRFLEVDTNWGGGYPTPSTETHDWSDGETVKTSREGHPVVQWGIFHVTAQEDGRHFLHVPVPGSVDEALEFNPLTYFPKTVEAYREQFQKEYDAMLRTTGDVAYPIPHHYTTAFHWPLAILGFELLCEVGMEEDAFHSLMERFAEISRRITTAWSQVEGLEAIILHDDLTMSSGPVFRPGWYREHIFPFYPDIFKPLKEKGIPIIFTSDGNCTCFLDDIFNAGADGLNFEYLVDMEHIVERHGDKILVGNISSDTIAHGSEERITREVTRCIRIGSRAPGFMVNVGGGLTHDIPMQNLEYYVSLRKRLCRELA